MVLREEEALYDRRDPGELESRSLSYLAACCLARRRRTRCGGRRLFRVGRHVGEAARPGGPPEGHESSTMAEGEAFNPSAGTHSIVHFGRESTALEATLETVYASAKRTPAATAAAKVA